MAWDGLVSGSQPVILFNFSPVPDQNRKTAETTRFQMPPNLQYRQAVSLKIVLAKKKRLNFVVLAVDSLAHL